MRWKLLKNLKSNKKKMRSMIWIICAISKCNNWVSSAQLTASNYKLMQRWRCQSTRSNNNSHLLNKYKDYHLEGSSFWIWWPESKRQQREKTMATHWTWFCHFQVLATKMASKIHNFLWSLCKHYELFLWKAIHTCILTAHVWCLNPLCPPVFRNLQYIFKFV